jgi:hypothetical protein
MRPIMAVRTRVAATLLIAVAIGGCSWLPIPKMSTLAEVQLDDLGNDTFSLTRRSGPFGGRSYVLKADAEQRALAVCAERHLALAMLDTRTDDPDPPAYSYATVTFRCVKP